MSFRYSEVLFNPTLPLVSEDLQLQTFGKSSNFDKNDYFYEDTNVRSGFVSVSDDTEFVLGNDVFELA